VGAGIGSPRRSAFLHGVRSIFDIRHVPSIARSDLIDHGLLPVGNLAATKARLRLMVVLSLDRPAGDLFPLD
jgi:hypothetical protein